MSLHLLKEAVLAAAAALRARQELTAAFRDLTYSQRALLDATVIHLAQNPREVTQQDYDALLAKLKG